MKNNNTYYCELVLLNKDKWVQHTIETVKSRDTKSEEEILRDIVIFDFKFGIIPVVNT